MRAKHHRVAPHQTAKARRLRRDSTIPERILWGELRNRKLFGLRFRRQYPIGPFIADFYCTQAQLVVEVDGMSHSGRADADRRRTEFIQRHGLHVLRVTNDDVLDDLDAVLMMIACEAGVDVC